MTDLGDPANFTMIVARGADGGHLRYSSARIALGRPVLGAAQPSKASEATNWSHSRT
jgi:hypothetical protein